MQPSLPQCKFVWGSADLIIANPTKAIENWLHYIHKSLDFNWKTKTRQTKREKILLYTVLSESPRIIKTFQGFLSDLLKLCKPGEFEFIDRRTAFPEPDFSRIRGFRLKQEELFRELHAAKRSGVVGAPCRYGKSKLIQNTLRIYPGVKTVVAAPGIDLLNQTVEELRAALPGRDVRGIFSGAKGKKGQSEEVTVTSLDSLGKTDKEGTQLVLVDEPHAAVSESRAPELAAFKNARIYGFGATTAGRYDGADKLITGIIGPVLARRTFSDAVAEGAICPIVCFMVRVEFSPFECWNRDGAYRSLIYKSPSFNALVKDIADNHIPADYQTLVFADEVKQVDLMSTFMADGVPAYAKNMKPAERRALFDGMAQNKIKRCVATDIFSTGVTFSDLRAMINATAGGANISSVQRAGRLAEIRPGKVAGFLIDFDWQATGYTVESLDDRDFDKSNNAWYWVVKDSTARMNAYRDLGYTVNCIESLDQIKII